MGFFLITEENWVQVLIEYSELGESEAHCVLQNPLIKLLFTFQEIDQSSRMANKSFVAPGADEYNLKFANCFPSSSSLDECENGHV
jgi:hypothetical protein